MTRSREIETIVLLGVRATSREIMEITEVGIEPCVNSKYVQPYRVRYKQNGQQKFWDCVKMHDSLAVLIYNKTRKAFVTVRQFRPAVYMSKNKPLWENSDIFPTSLSQKPAAIESSTPNPAPANTQLQSWSPAHEGCTLELCAGLVDKDASLEQIAREEILEETGYDVPLDKLERVNSYCSSIGTGGTQQQLFYCEVTDDMLAHGGGGNTHEGESIEVVYIPVEESMKVIFDSSQPKSSGLCFGFCWFDKYKRPHIDI